MNALDVWFLHVEDDVDLMHIGAVGIFDGPAPHVDDVSRLVEGKLDVLARYRQRVRSAPLGLARPVWVDDVHFHLPYHVRHTAVPPPGDRDDLLRLAGRVMSQPLDPRRPLWELWFIEGLAAGRWAILSKVHHCMVDGVAGAGLIAAMMAVTPDVDIPVAGPWEPEPEPSGPRLLAAAARSALTSSVNVRDRVVGGVGPLIRAATRTLRGTLALSTLMQHVPETSLNGPIGPHRRWAWAAGSLGEAKRVGAAFDVTVNDVVLAAVTRGFRDLLVGRGEPLHPVVTMVPVSIRQWGDDDHNRVAARFATLPVDVDDPVERLQRIAAESRRLKDSGEEFATTVFIAVSGLLPQPLLAVTMRGATRLAQRVGQRRVNTVTTNVPGPQVPLFVLGRRMRELYPYVPIAESVRLGVAVFSYDWQLTFGVTGDYDTAPDVDVLAEGIETGLSELTIALRSQAPPPAATARR